MAEEAKQRNKGGRPRKEGQELKGAVLHVYFTEAEYAGLIKEAASLEGHSIAGWARAVLMREAQRILAQQDRA